MRKKAIALITTGFPISIKPKSHSGSITFALLVQHTVNILKPSQNLHPEIYKYISTIAFINLSPNKVHPRPYYNFDSENSKLQQFGLWVQLGDGNATGFWVEESDIMVSAKTSKSSQQKRKTNIILLYDTILEKRNGGESLQLYDTSTCCAPAAASGAAVEAASTIGMNDEWKGDIYSGDDYQGRRDQVMGLVLSWLGLVRSKAYRTDPDPSIEEL
ncbi:hypothetical protein BCON_0080g00050 [Botryotinia convoluta]|uniref:Uncharacterized protein n=1 Tax=Botryotinia convoluta TaxID=54673 RepID=A0A4Z1I3J4_9HELO|nr:hypothetical protein BCON_0080g00050 [Botryotinia convoluta]